MSGFWNAYIWLLTLGTLGGCLWLLQAMTTKRKQPGPVEDTTGHSWDGDLEEYNNPLPRWWLTLFWITGIFMIVYLVIYPGLGNFAGVMGWNQVDQYEAERAAAEERYGDIFAAFAARPVAELATDPDALRVGRNLFLNNCTGCHGSDGGGARGYPNLTDGAWLYGGTPDAIVQTITLGRNGVMPALGAALGEGGIDEVIAYLRALPRLQAAAPAPAGSPAGTTGAAQQLTAQEAAGQQKFQTFCIACHGMDAHGNQALGAPNLTDNDWLHGRTDADIRSVILDGRTNHMPAHEELLTPDRIHVLAAYVLSLSAEGGS